MKPVREEEESDDEQVDESEVQRNQELAAKRRGQRGSILAESYAVDANWKPPVHAKTPGQAAQITAALKESFLFQSLPTENFKQVVDAFRGPLAYTVGQQVIRQGGMVESGEPGLFVLESGKLDVYIKTEATEHNPLGNHVFTYDKMGQTFGELALLYSCPRAATVVCAADSVLWSLDRDTFNNCVKQGYQRLRQRRAACIESVEILKSLTASEREKIVDVVQSQTFDNGQQIIKTGDRGDRFYMVEEGRAMASMHGRTVKEYGPGSYFGELALLKQQARVVDVFAAATPTVLCFLDADTFRRLLGPLNELMHERAKDYDALDFNEEMPADVHLEGYDTRGPAPVRERNLVQRLLGDWCASCGCTPGQFDSVPPQVA